MHQSNGYNGTIVVGEDCEPIAIPQHCAWTTRCAQSIDEIYHTAQADYCHMSAAACALCQGSEPTIWCEESVPDCAFTPGDPSTCGAGCNYIAGKSHHWVTDTDSLSLSKPSYGGWGLTHSHTGEHRAAQRTVALSTMLLALNDTEVHGVNVMQNQYQSATPVPYAPWLQAGNHTVINFRITTARDPRPWTGGFDDMEALVSSMLNPLGSVACISVSFLAMICQCGSVLLPRLF